MWNGQVSTSYKSYSWIGLSQSLGYGRQSICIRMIKDVYV